jgi:hypothetical protein
MEILQTAAALAANAAIVGLEIVTLSRIAHKGDILKYYTYLSNLMALIAGVAFLAVTTFCLFTGSTTPLWLKGLRFCATYMLVTTLFVFSFVLLPLHNSGNLISASDFTSGFSPRLANLILHYLCPLISAFSFLLLERQPVLAGSQWTLYGAIPTIAYWIIYLILTAAHLWKEPYGLSDATKTQGFQAGTILFALIPLMSMGLDYLLWWLNTLDF